MVRPSTVFFLVLVATSEYTKAEKTHPAVLGQFPYIVSLRYKSNGTSFCSGSIISGKWIVTSAHCLDGNPLDVVVSVGTVENNKNTSNSLEIEEIVKHPSFTTSTKDIGLLKVDQLFDFSENVEKISLGHISPKSKFITIGFGDEKSENPNLKFADVVVEEDDPKCFNSDFFICGKVEGGFGGDTGGALVDTVTKKLVGVSSFRGAKGYADGYTKVSPFEDWITSYMDIQEYD